MPKMSPVSTVVPSANNRTWESTSTVGMGSVFGGSQWLMARTDHQVTSSPTRPPLQESVTLSIRSWRTSRPWLAPNAVRIAISCCRVAVLASRRLATLAQAMSSTKLTAASSTSNLVLSSGLMSPSNMLIGFTPQSRSSGYCCFILSEMVFISARAC